MQTIASRLETINDKIGHAVSWLLPVMVFVTFAVVVLRYGFDLGWIAMQETIIYLHASIFMLGIAYTLKEDGHVRVDIFYQNLSEKGKARVNLFGTLLLLVPVCSFMLYSSFDYVATSWDLKETSSDPGGLPWVYLLKTLLVITPVLVLLQGIAMILHNLVILRKTAEE